MTCPRCSSRMYRTSLIYETNGMENFSIMDDSAFFKCLICGHYHFLQPNKKRIFIKGQKIKDVTPLD